MATVQGAPSPAVEFWLGVNHPIRLADGQTIHLGRKEFEAALEQKGLKKAERQNNGNEPGWLGSVSRKHLGLFFFAGTVWIFDRGSTNGTYLDRVRLKLPDTLHRVELKGETRIQVGSDSEVTLGIKRVSFTFPTSGMDPQALVEHEDTRHLFPPGFDPFAKKIYYAVDIGGDFQPLPYAFNVTLPPGNTGEQLGEYTIGGWGPGGPPANLLPGGQDPEVSIASRFGVFEVPVVPPEPEKQGKRTDEGPVPTPFQEGVGPAPDSKIG